MKDFLKGASYIIRGCRDFYSDKKAWKYAALPAGVLAAVYILIGMAVVMLCRGAVLYVQNRFDSLPGYLAWLGAPAGVLIWLSCIAGTLLLLAATVCTLYEISGGIFFDPLIEYYVKKHYNIPPPPFSLRRILRTARDVTLSAVRNMCILCLLLLLSLFMPGIGQVLVCIVMGHYLAISCLITPAAAQDTELPRLKMLIDKHRMLTCGFGICAYLLLLIPFAVIFILPGLVLGSTALFHEELYGSRDFSG